MKIKSFHLKQEINLFFAFNPFFLPSFYTIKLKQSILIQSQKIYFKSVLSPTVYYLCPWFIVVK